MDPGDELLQLSGLQHLVYCERQWALIHVEKQWAENRWTAEGRVLHERTDSDEVEVRPGLRIVRGLYIQSARLGVSGRADVVEFHEVSAGAAGMKTPPGGPEPAGGGNDALWQLNQDSGQGAVLPGVEGRWRPFPVEYKRGRPKKDLCDKVQLCAQAMCLEEMFRVGISSGALFYGKTHRRLDVAFDDALRAETQRLAERMHALFAGGQTPPAVYHAKKCGNCSLFELCMPKPLDRPKQVARYVQRMLDARAEAPAEEDSP